MQLRDAIGNQGRLPGAACGSECSIGGCHCHHCDAAVANRTASATDRPCAARTSTCRNLATISSSLCLFLAIRILLRLQKPYFREDHFSGGRPLLGIAIVIMPACIWCFDASYEKERWHRYTFHRLPFKLNDKFITPAGIKEPPGV